ncbi:MAG: ATP-dependent helicase RecG [Candidatus Sumerlaeota bacterium]|nr:ATP-dependent helicase RecG [Candidatus Sumerlaeota bacterium]
MYDTVEELMQKITLGEDSTIEFKAVRIPGSKVNAPTGKDLADEIAAFANTDDGVLLLGVNDEGEVEGVPTEKLEILEEHLRNACTDLIHPPPKIAIRRQLLPSTAGDKLPVLKVDIFKGLFLHTSPGGTKWRVGSKCTKMPDVYADRRRQQLSLSRFMSFDEMPIPYLDPEVLNEDLLAQVLPSLGSDQETLLRKMKFITPDEDGTLRPTVGGVLFATPKPVEHLRNAYIDAVAFQGDEIVTNYQLDHQIIEGPIHEQIEKAFIFCKSNTKTRAIKAPARTEYPQYSERALFEAIVNAVAHRDYTVASSHIRLFIFSNRIEIYSPGGFPNTLDAESIALRQAHRNPLISSVLSRYAVPETLLGVGRTRLMDQLGAGVPIILKESEELSGIIPTYRDIDDSEILLTIFAANAPTPPEEDQATP